MFEAEMGGNKARAEARRLEAKKRREEAKKKRLEREAFVKKCEEEKIRAESTHQTLTFDTPGVTPDDYPGVIPDPNTRQVSIPILPKLASATQTSLQNTKQGSIHASTLLPTPPPSNNHTAHNITDKDRMMQQAKALREQRAKNREMNQGARAMQKVYRSFVDVKSLRATLKKDYDAKIAATLKLIQALKQKGGAPYVCPPATVSSLARQFLFCHPSPASVASRRQLGILCDFLILPGLSVGDTSLHPLASWPGHGEGRLRLGRLLRACVSAMGTDDGFTQSTLSKFLRCLLLGEPAAQPAALDRWCAEFVLGEEQANVVGSLRSYLLSCNGLVPSPPRPSNSSRSSSTSVYFNLVSDLCSRKSASDDGYSLSLFLRQVLSVPVLSYKLSDADLSRAYRDVVPPAADKTLKMLHLYNRAPVTALLPVYSAASIPVPPSLALFGNLVSALRLSPPSAEEGGVFLERIAPLLTLLLGEVPLSTFGSRRAVAWVKTGTVTSKAVLVPEVATEEAKTFLRDGVLRRICSYVETGEEGELEEALAAKGKADVEMEKWSGGRDIS
eukprot:CAMPEP_0197573996 /NCGR_PEP_ID=MMETSP1320-20131121/43246_1 /TAXON_ID=91990 /ORGANISM="Bolidomonas sp., Strain RCC2347" /LENGTH=558 /DNA_ID=CAMNT_0043136511 /DNA_START=31 /DNA_END=1704 /DNA_ORIENTATION=+